MMRLNLALLLALIISSLYLVRTSYEARRMFSSLEVERTREQQLAVQSEQLELAQRAQATPLRVEKIAREKLRMFNASPAVTQYVGMRAAALPAGPAPQAAPESRGAQ